MCSAVTSVPVSDTPETPFGSRKGDPPSDLLVCMDSNQLCTGTIPHALAVASAFGGKVILLHVIDAAASDNGRHLDPVDWEIRRREARSRMHSLAKQYQAPDCQVETCILEGRTCEQICSMASRNPNTITVVCRQLDDDLPATGRPALDYCSHIARKVLEADSGSVLMVPRRAFARTPHTYKNILLSLDGSSTAESAVPKAVRLARAQNAKLTVCHIAAEPDVPRMGPPDAELDRLRTRLKQRGRQVGQDYLHRIKDALRDCGVSVTTTLIDGGDVRRTLVQTARHRHADLIVLASHGQGGYSDVPSGHVTSYVLDHSEVPVLMVRQQKKAVGTHVVTDTASEGVRRPGASGK